MSLSVNNQMWQIIEKLYIHCYTVNGFSNFLKSCDVVLPDNFYENFEVYGFMTTENFKFSQFMQLVPTYKYLPIIEKIIFDERIENTQIDNWNYFGVYIKDWYSEILQQLKQAGFIIDESRKRIIFEESDEDRKQNSTDLLILVFKDEFLDYIKKEINETYNNGHYLSVMILSRKLAECLVVRVFEIVFRKQDERGVYNGNNHSLWYDVARKRILGFDTLLDNLKKNSSSFAEDKDRVEDVCRVIKPFKNEINMFVHRDYKIPDKKTVLEWDIPGIFNKLGRLYKKYCNP